MNAKEHVEKRGQISRCMRKDEDPPPEKKWVMNVKKQRGRKRRIVQRFKTSRLLSLLRHFKVRSSSRWDGFLS